MGFKLLEAITTYIEIQVFSCLHRYTYSWIPMKKYANFWLHIFDSWWPQ